MEKLLAAKGLVDKAKDLFAVSENSHDLWLYTQLKAAGQRIADRIAQLKASGVKEPAAKEPKSPKK